MAYGQKTGGRKAGTPNKTTKALREQLLAILQPTIEELPDTLAAMEPTERAKVLTGLLPYVMPKMATVDIAAEVDYAGKEDWQTVNLSKLSDDELRAIINREFA